MASQAEVGEGELLEIDICEGEILSEEESGVFVNLATSYSDGIPLFGQWAVSGHVGQPGESALERTADEVTAQPASQVPKNARTPGGSVSSCPGNGETSEDEPRCLSRASILDCLLVELYDTYDGCYKRSADSMDSSTEASSSDAFLGRSNSGSAFLQELQEKHTGRYQIKYLAQKDPEELKSIIYEVRYRIGIQSAKLVRQLKRKDRLHNKVQKKCDIVTACLQAVSPKRWVDTRLKFTLEPSLGKNGFQQWFDALKAVARLPTGIPREWRKRVWLTLADQYLHSISIDWEKTLRFAFNDRSNPDDDSLGIQIVKDLHRTGCSSYCGQEGEQDRVVLKRVLLAYARWNKNVGYCQGFNVLAALILEVTEGNEGDALKVMIYLIDKVLPDSYFANNLRALSVDMAVFRDLLRLKLPELSQHLHYLQKAANRKGGGSYEPPLTNVFTMQWFLTLFATCLPHHTVLKIWDSVFFEGSEVLLRVALAIWVKLAERIEYCQSADEFYSTMGCLTQEMLENNLIDSNELMQMVYSMAAFPFPQLAELREKYTYNITPFPAPIKASGSQGGHVRDSDDEADVDDEDSLASILGCLGPFGGLLAPELQKYQKHLKDQQGELSQPSRNIAELSPGAVEAGRAEHQAAINSMMMERMSTDINALKKQYTRIKKRQQQAGLLYTRGDKCPATSLLASQVHLSPVVNHLLLGKEPKGLRGSRNDLVPGPLPQAHSSPVRNGSPRGRAHSPWRAHVRTHRQNVARARAQLGFMGMAEPVDDETEEAESIGEVESMKQEPDQEGEGTPPEVVLPPPQAELEEGLEQVEQKLASLELEQEPEPCVPPETESVPDSDAPVPVLPPPPQPGRRKESDSSSSSESGSGSSLQRSPSVATLSPRAPPTAFSPFPSVKPLRKSAAARNLGLYGPTARTPTVHLPQMSKGMRLMANSATKRR
ncbi:TBC1 domain family member 30 isoform X2 [Brienomyrus brachyistius]|uniref:TBC1 domain family member 30 isoform X2 n=1 Tax=Brienomyrus brachyistius TaxID=42636 RepID=UPI0020B25AFD|nr:TBC1 domain family member 30 isoform X2 [Brienomyrus brachyistius]